ncbi:MAG: beta-propeller fold lactonase family protein [Nitrososphaeraceae archaeon]
MSSLSLLHSILILAFLSIPVCLDQNNHLSAHENTDISNDSIPNISNISNTELSPSSLSSVTRSLESGINVDTYPTGITVNPSTKKIYVANELSNTVSVVDIQSLDLEKTIGVGDFPYAIDSNALNNRIYVTNRGSNSVSVIDGSTDSILYNVSVEQTPIGIAVNPAASWIYVANLDSGSISVIDGITNTVYETIRLGGIPYGIAVNPLTNRIYVTDISSDSVHVIDGATNGYISDVKVGMKPVGIAVDARSDTVYVANHDSNDLSIVNGSTNRLIENIPLDGTKPVGVALNPVSDRLYVSNIGSDTVSVVDVSNVGNSSVLKNIRVNPSIKSSYNEAGLLVDLPVNVDFPLVASFITLDPTDNLAYLTNTASNTISVIDGETDSLAINIMFDASPPDSGDIECNGVIRISENSTLYNRGEVIQCTAIPERGFVFDSWSGLVNDLNSNPLTVEVSEFGTLTANFKPALSPEAYVFMLGGVAGASSIFLGWYYKYGQRRYVRRYLTRIETTYDTLHKIDKEQCILQLQNIRKELLYLYKKGSLSDSHYNILDKKAIDFIESIKRGEEYL